MIKRKLPDPQPRSRTRVSCLPDVSPTNAPWQHQPNADTPLRKKTLQPAQRSLLCTGHRFIVENRGFDSNQADKTSLTSEIDLVNEFT